MCTTHGVFYYLRMETETNETAWVVYCETHGHYLAHVSAGGTTWTNNQSEARRYDTKPSARAAAQKATWLDHRLIVWAVTR